MEKISSLFKRDYQGSRQAYDEVVPGCEWVIDGDGIPTIKWDGTACMARKGTLYKRYDRKLKKGPYKRKKHDPSYQPTIDDYKPSPDGWEACESEPNFHTGHWPGWMPIRDIPEDQWFAEAWSVLTTPLADGTYELVGPKVGTNPYNLGQHEFWPHGEFFPSHMEPPRNFSGLYDWFEATEVEGIVWHHPDGRMCKIKRRDFGFSWPSPNPI